MDIFITVVNSINKNNVAEMKLPDSIKISKLLYIHPANIQTSLFTKNIKYI
jgi:hypothetical protein